MPAKQPENVLVDAIRSEIRRLGGKSVKTHGSAYSEIGTPDILGCLKGRMFAVEGKQPGEEPTPIQRKRLAEWLAAGAVVGVAHSVKEFLEIVEELL